MYRNSISDHIRLPAVAGQFYPEQPEQLLALMQQLDTAAKPAAYDDIKAIISPHAGYIYSGAIASSAYQSLKQQAPDIKRVILLGPSHRVAFRGIAVSSASLYRTPLGDIEIDQLALETAEALPQTVKLDEAHRYEHALEVQLPFLQRTLGEFSLLPLVIGDCSAASVAQLLEQLWGGAETLIVVSSDLSHYHAYRDAQQRDLKTSQAIESMNAQIIQPEDACGSIPVRGLIMAASKHHLVAHTIDIRNSGDTAGDQQRVVGYGAYLFTAA